MAGRSTPPSGRRTPTASPAKRRPLAESRSPRWCLAWPGESIAAQPPAPAEVDLLAVAEDVHPLARRRVEAAKERVEERSVDHLCRADERVGSTRCRAPFSCTYTVAPGKARATSPTPPAWSRWMWVTTTPARSPGATPSSARRGEQDLDRALAAGLDEDRPRALDQVTGAHLLPAAEQGVDLHDAGSKVTCGMRIRRDRFRVPAREPAGNFRRAGRRLLDRTHAIGNTERDHARRAPGCARPQRRPKDHRPRRGGRDASRRRCSLAFADEAYTAAGVTLLDAPHSCSAPPASSARSSRRRWRRWAS